jgi:CRP-like cAMP-binding protein
MDLQVLRNVDLFRNLDGVQLAHLASIVQEQVWKKGHVLFREGDASEYFYVICKGRVRISKVVSGFGEEALAILEEGSYFGEMELIDESIPRAAQATCHDDCILQAFRIADFHQLLAADHELAMAVLWSFVRTLGTRLRATNDRVAAFFAMAKFG